MSIGTEPTPPPPDAEGLQFDHAEFGQADAPTSIICASCHRPVAGAYYEINGTIFCEDCRALVEQHFKGGSKVARFAKALFYGTGAAIAGSLIYLLVMHYSQHEFALVSILCGYLIGKAVRAGTGNRGGLAYQVMAVLLTYLAIGAAHAGVEFITIDFPSMRQQAQAAGVSVAQLYIGLAVLFANVSVMFPLDLARSSVLSLAIMGFGIWESWKLTRRAKLVVTGPYRVGGEVVLEPHFEKVDGDA